MEYLRLLYELPAIVAGTTIVAYMSPWKFQARLLPLVMFIVGLLVLLMPQLIDMALCLTIPAAWLMQRILGIEVDNHEPLRVKLPTIRAPKFELRQFATRAFPNPLDDDADAPEDVEDVDDPPEREESSQVSTVPSYVPSLLG